MKKLLFIFTLLLALTLAACAEPPAETFATIPTPPSIPEDQTPLQILSNAREKTLTLEPLRLEYCRDGETFSCSGSADEALQTAGEWIPNPDFLAAFCSLPLQAIPSNTGIVRYQLTGLTAAELSALLGIEISTDADCAVALEVDSDGYLARFEYQAGPSARSISLCMD